MDSNNNNDPTPSADAFKDRMAKIMSVLDASFNGGLPEKKVGVVVMVFPYGDPEGTCTYMSNGASKADMAKLFKNQAIIFEESEFRNKEPDPLPILNGEWQRFAERYVPGGANTKKAAIFKKFFIAGMHRALVMLQGRQVV